MPEVNTKTALELLVIAQKRANEISLGRLSDFAPASPLTAILEAVAAVASQTITQVNELSNTLEANRIAVFGLEKRVGLFATGTAQIRLDALYSEPFYLARGLEVTFGQDTFITITDATIPAYTESALVTVAAIASGKVEAKNGTQGSFAPIERVLSITLSEDTRGGRDAETEAEWKQRIYGTIRRRDTLLSPDDFEDDVIDFLGEGSSALAIGRLKDKTTYQNGYVSVFGLNSDGSQLNSAQISQLQDYLFSKVAMGSLAVYSMEPFNLNVSVLCSFLSNVSPDAIAAEIYKIIDVYFKPGTLPPGQAVLNKALEFRINTVIGIIEGAVNVKFNGLASPQALPNAWSFARWSAISVRLIKDDDSTPFDYSYSKI